jgi:exosortase/archaeosortase family protein
MEPTPTSGEGSGTGSRRAAAIQLAVLGILWLVAFRAEILETLQAAGFNPESAHGLAAPVLIGLLVWLRRDVLAREPLHPSAWGIALIAAGLVAYAATAWPFNFAYVRRLSIVPVLAGAVLAVCGPRVTWRCLPMVVLALIAINVPTRLYASLIIRPETFTLKAVAAILDTVPGVMVEAKGSDLSWSTDGASGWIALGEPYRGASLMLASAALGLFVTYSRVRPWWHIAILGAAAVPIVLLCNLVRLTVWGLATIWLEAGPLDLRPQSIAIVASLLLAYGLFALAAAALERMKMVHRRGAEAAEAAKRGSGF